MVVLVATLVIRVNIRMMVIVIQRLMSSASASHSNIGALITRLAFWSQLYCKYNKEHPIYW